MNTNLKKAVAIVLTVIPILSALWTTIIWIDTRYMHKEISDIRFVDVQLIVAQGHMRDYERMISKGMIMTEEEKTEYDLEKQKYIYLTQERDKLMGLIGTGD